jgi:hypothetical protein
MLTAPFRLMLQALLLTLAILLFPASCDTTNLM